jgi:hypothetical protein
MLINYTYWGREGREGGSIFLDFGVPNMFPMFLMCSQLDPKVPHRVPQDFHNCTTFYPPIIAKN